MNTEPMVTKTSMLSMQVCVPNDWTDEQVVAFANQQNPSGLDNGWSIRRQGSRYLAGAPERAACAGDEGRPGFVHIMLDC